MKSEKRKQHSFEPGWANATNAAEASAARPKVAAFRTWILGAARGAATNGVAEPGAASP